MDQNLQIKSTYDVSEGHDEEQAPSSFLFSWQHNQDGSERLKLLSRQIWDTDVQPWTFFTPFI